MNIRMRQIIGLLIDDAVLIPLFARLASVEVDLATGRLVICVVEVVSVVDVVVVFKDVTEIILLNFVWKTK